MDIINKIRKLYKLDTYFFQPHYEHSYYLKKKSQLDFNTLIQNKIDKNLIYKKKLSNLTEDIYFINEKFNNFENIRIRTYLEGDYKYSANIIFVLKNNNNNKEKIYVTVHKNIYDIDDFINQITIQLYKEFNFILKFFIKKYKTIYFIKDFKFNNNKIKEDYLSIAFEEIIDVYDENHQKINKKFFLSNYILEIEYAGLKCKIKANEIKKHLFIKLSNSFDLLEKKNRKSFEIISSIINSS